MNIAKNAGMYGATAAVLLVGAAAWAQQKPIADQDLLNLMESVDNKGAAATPTSAEADAALGEAMDMLEAAGESVMASNAVDEVVDDLGMSEVSQTQTISGDNLISVRLDKVGLEEAISLFAQLAQANIIVPELAESTQISVNLKDVEWRPALQSILDTYDYELYQKVSGSNVYSVRRRPEGAPEPQVVETFVLKYANIPSVAELVRELLPENAKISEFASRNMLVIKSTESSLSEVRAVLQSIDTVRQQVFIESKFMELSDSAQKDLGIDWSVLQSYGIGASSIAYDYSSERASSSSDSSAWNKFTDISGNEYEASDGSYSESQRGGSALSPWTLSGITPSLSQSGGNAAAKSTSQILTSVLSADDFSLVLSALEANSGVNVVSNPKIIVANEELANISIVRKEPNLKQERQQSATDSALDNITYSMDETTPFFEYGIKLDVTPSINTSSNITVKIVPSLTRKYADKEAGDNTYPIIDEKKIETVFSLADGQTAAIGGLTEVTESESEKKVPLLGSIPFLGRFFSWSETVHGQEETIIFVTVGLANTQQISVDTGMPGDAELARRQIIKDNNGRTLRDQGRSYFEAEEEDKLDDMMKVIDAKEAQRILRRNAELDKQAREEAQKAEKRKAKEAAAEAAMASVN
ncbi:type II secretion system protein GspD [Pontiella sp.]|uniref:type II secretion system protein GspD n=1 Tax=Pontiella sp. TaxID=2837462 RepID=UPI003567674F